MTSVLKASERAARSLGWVESRHSFNEGGVDAVDLNGFRALREINDDTIAPGAGFPMHPHKDMEIICFVVKGGMLHEDSNGHRSSLGEGDVLRLSSGSGIGHKESNVSSAAPLHFIQIWIKPSKTGMKPAYEHMHFTEEERSGRLRLLVSGDREEDAVFIHQDAQIYTATLKAGEQVRHRLGANRNAWVQMISGSAVVNLKAMEGGDGASISGEPEVAIECVTQCELLLFNLG